MVDIIKQDMTDIWAVAGDVVAPDSEKVRAGWAVEAVPRQWWNWFENRQDTNIAYMLQKGIPEWDQFTEYLTNKSYVQRNNIVYKCILTGVNKDPATQPTYWVKAFPESSAYLETIRPLAVSNNSMAYIDGAGVAQNTPTTAYGRSVLNAADALALRTLDGSQVAHSNLTALSGIVASTNALPYFTGTTTMGTTTLTAFGRSLIDDTDAATARATLGLGNTATLDIGTTAGTVAAGDDARIVNALQKANNLSDLTNAITARSNLGLTSAAITSLTASSSDSTVGRILRVADFGIGTQGVLVGDINALSNTGTGFYKLGTPFTGAPLANTSFTVIHQAYDNERTQIATQEGVATARTFVRKYSGGAWSSWVELYHTGNTQSIVDQVTAGIQPSLDAKVSKAGDAMTGTLTVPQIELGTTGGTPFIDFHSSASPADYNARIYGSGGTATSNSGVLNYTAASHVFSGPITGTISNATTLNSNIPISQVTSLQATLDAKMPLTGAGTPNFTSLRFTGGMNAGAGQGGYLIWNEAGDGRSTYLNNQGSGSGGFVFRNVNTANTVETGRVTFGANGSISCAVQCNVGDGVFAQDGNCYGTIWGGWLSNWMAGALVYKTSLRQDSVTYLQVGEIGSVAFCYTNVGVTPGQQVLGSNLLYGFAAGQGGVTPPGTWRCHGDVSPGQRTLFMRVA